MVDTTDARELKEATEWLKELQDYRRELSKERKNADTSEAVDLVDEEISSCDTDIQKLKKVCRKLSRKKSRKDVETW